jgi:hypothetical protein
MARVLPPAFAIHSLRTEISTSHENLAFGSAAKSKLTCEPFAEL